jgi:aerobic-type carbon monoxide dehydrogenase small subunit (CoxS/CutS family)
LVQTGRNERIAQMDETQEFTLIVNGEQHRVKASADMPLLWALRQEAGLTGTKFGCGEGLCGAGGRG